MMIPLGHNLRKWLLRLALTARDRLQALALRLDTGEEEKAAGNEPVKAAGDSKAVRPAGPPDHWVHLVKHHAPELLRPGSTHVVTDAPSEAAEPDSGISDLPREGFRIPGSGTGRSASEWQSGPLLPPGSQVGPEDTDSKPWDTVNSNPGRTNGGGGAGPVFSKSARERTSILNIDIGGQDTANTGIPPASQAGLDTAIRRPMSSRKPNDSTSADEKAPSGHRPAGSPDRRSILNHGTPAAGEQPQHLPAASVHSENAPALEPSGRQQQPVNPRQSGNWVNARHEIRMPKRKKPGQDDALASALQSGQSESGAASADGPGPKVIVSPPGRSSRGGIPGNEEHRAGGRPNDAQVSGTPEKIVGERSPAELRWPALPGEEDSEVAGDTLAGASWPVLAAGGSIAARSSFTRRPPPAAGAGYRKSERLRRLDEEQKGRLWNASHF